MDAQKLEIEDKSRSFRSSTIEELLEESRIWKFSDKNSKANVMNFIKKYSNHSDVQQKIPFGGHLV